MLEVLVEGIVLGLCLAAILISLLLLAKFMVDGVTVALRPIPIEVGEGEMHDDYATVPMQSCEAIDA